jgi:hypothetical protein
VSSTIMGAKCISCINKSSNIRRYKKKANMWPTHLQLCATIWFCN